MGGRGSRFGKSVKGKKYGSEFSTLLHVGNIKFVKYNNGATTAPMETRAKNRIYVTVTKQNKVKHIDFYKNGKRYKQIDVIGKPHYIDGVAVLPHTHFGYKHDENGTYHPTKEENDLIAKVQNMWKNRK